MVSVNQKYENSDNGIFTVKDICDLRDEKGKKNGTVIKLFLSKPNPGFKKQESKMTKEEFKRLTNSGVFKLI